MGRYEVHQTDGNAHGLYEAARKMGMSVEVINRPVDALVGFQGLTVAVEVKTERGKLRRGQVQFFERFTGAATIWRTLEDVQATRALLSNQAKRIRGGAECTCGTSIAGVSCPLHGSNTCQSSAVAPSEASQTPSDGKL